MLLRFARGVVGILGDAAQDERAYELRKTCKAAEARRHEWPARDRAMLTATLRILTDLALEGWSLRVRRGTVEVRAAAGVADREAEKARIRRQELVKRDEQLSRPAARTFVMEMEQRRLRATQFVSIFSLMRDGRELAAKRRGSRAYPEHERTGMLREIVDPYIEFVTDEGRCATTGLRLQDIWRYFRHTWANQYASVPGRTMTFLVRDRAAPLHPVIGIASLSSSIVQIRDRDCWIGWHPDVVCERIRDKPSLGLAMWVRETLEGAIGEIYVDDLIEDDVIKVSDLRRPTEDVWARLVAQGTAQRALHHRNAEARDHKKQGALTWEEKARTHLFRSKRALTLASLLRAKGIAESVLGATASADALRRLLSTADGQWAVRKIVRKAKADRVGIAMADITVCGAVPPYSPILGGKLVAMLAASPEVIQAYGERYRDVPSEIASSMAGRPIVRRPTLVLLGTTSLYGVGSSQYNRVRIPASLLGGTEGEEIRYVELGRSEAYGTSHYSDGTVEALVQVVQQAEGGQRVNSIFGEGVSPRLRKIRDGLDLLRFPSAVLLRHGRERVVYVVPLARNAREYLLGLQAEPEYLFVVRGAEATARIAEWWRRRWLCRRIEWDDVLSQVETHTLVRPIRHGARVRLEAANPGQIALFDDLHG